MNSLMFLKVAYVVAWVIYLGYLGRILLRMKTVIAERQELERTSLARSQQQVLTTEAPRH